MSTARHGECSSQKQPTMPIIKPPLATRTFTVKHLLLAGAALCATAAAAEARPKRIVVKAVDGKRELADVADSALRKALREYEFASLKSWNDAQQAARKAVEGAAAWARAARSTGVGAVVEGFIKQEGRHDVLIVTIFDAVDGHALDTLTVRLGADGLSKTQKRELYEGLDQRLKWIDPDDEPQKPAPEIGIGGADTDALQKKPKIDDVLKPEPTQEPRTKPKDTVVAGREGCFDTEAECAVRADLANPEKPELPERTTMFSFWTALYLDSRSLTWDAPGDADLDQYTGVGGKGFVLGG